MEQQLYKSSSKASFFFFPCDRDRIPASALVSCSSKAVSPTKAPWWIIHITSVRISSLCLILWSNGLLLGKKIWPECIIEAASSKRRDTSVHLIICRLVSLDYEVGGRKDFTWVLLLESFDRGYLSLQSLGGIHVDTSALPLCYTGA